MIPLHPSLPESISKILLHFIFYNANHFMKPTDLYLQQANRILSLHSEQSKISIKSLANHGISFYFLHFQQISSTMTLSDHWNQNLLEPDTVFIFSADQQTKGRGQKSNTWQSPSGNIYMTILSRQHVSIIPYLYFSLCSIIADSIEKSVQEKLEVQVKWINDLLLENRKIGGVLIKSDIYQNELFIQVGIGINVQSTPIQSAGCLRECIKGKLDQDWVETFIERLSIKVVEIKENLMNKYNERLIYKNEIISILDENKGVIKGKFVGINKYGFAILEQENGEKKEVSSGRMRKQ